MPQGGFGNLIAQPRAARPGQQRFVNDDFEPWPDQWSFLASLGRISRAQAERTVQETERWGRRLPPQEDKDTVARSSQADEFFERFACAKVAVVRGCHQPLEGISLITLLIRHVSSWATLARDRAGKTAAEEGLTLYTLGSSCNEVPMDTPPDDPAGILYPLIGRFATELMTTLVRGGMSERAAQTHVAAGLARVARGLWNRPQGG